MALAISTNFAINANTALNAMNKSQSLMGKSISRISTGNRAANPADDPLSYFSGNKIKGDTDGYQALYNGIQDGAARLNVADTALSSIIDVLTEMKSKAIAYDAADGDADAQASIQKAYTQLYKSLATFEATQYKGSDVWATNNDLTFVTSLGGTAAAADADDDSGSLNLAGDTTAINGLPFTSIGSTVYANSVDKTKKGDADDLSLSIGTEAAGAVGGLSGTVTYGGVEFTVDGASLKYGADVVGSVAADTNGKLTFTIDEDEFTDKLSSVATELQTKLGWENAGDNTAFSTDDGAVTFDTTGTSGYVNDVTGLRAALVTEDSGTPGVSSYNFDTSTSQITDITNLTGDLTYTDGAGNSAKFSIENGELFYDTQTTASGTVTLDNSNNLTVTINEGTYGGTKTPAGSGTLTVSKTDAIGKPSTDDTAYAAVTGTLSTGTGDTIQAAIDSISNRRVALGGSLAAMDAISSYLSSMTTANEAAYTAVTEANIAKEMTSYVKNNVYSQAAQAMISQANQSLAQVLNLLQ